MNHHLSGSPFAWVRMGALLAFVALLFACNPYARWLYETEPVVRPSSAGEHRYMGGQAYVGQVENGVPHGNGTLTFSDGRVYRGQFVKGKMSGQGGLRSSNGMELLGTYKDGTLQHGPAVMLLSDGLHRVGRYDGKGLNGQGTILRDGQAIYSGQLKSGQASGQGWGMLEDGTEYVGQWSKDEPNGIDGACTNGRKTRLCHFREGQDRTEPVNDALAQRALQEAIAEVAKESSRRIERAEQEVSRARKDEDEAHSVVKLYTRNNSALLGIEDNGRCDYAAEFKDTPHFMADDSCVWNDNKDLYNQCYCSWNLCLLTSYSLGAPKLTKAEKAQLARNESAQRTSCSEIRRALLSGRSPSYQLERLEDIAASSGAIVRKAEQRMTREKAAAERAAEQQEAHLKANQANARARAERTRERQVQDRLRRHENACKSKPNTCGCRPPDSDSACATAGSGDSPSVEGYRRPGCVCEI